MSSEGDMIRGFEQNIALPATLAFSGVLPLDSSTPGSQRRPDSPKLWARSLLGPTGSTSSTKAIDYQTTISHSETSLEHAHARVSDGKLQRCLGRQSRQSVDREARGVAHSRRRCLECLERERELFSLWAVGDHSQILFTMTSQIFYVEGQSINTKSVTQLYHLRPTVHRVELESGPFRHTIPPSVTTVVIKQQKDEWEEEFKKEIQAYEKLSDVQGITIRHLYGQGVFNGIPALILSDLGGITLFDLGLKRSQIDDKMLENELHKAVKSLYDHGVEYWDEKLDNYLFCEDGKVRIVDLELVEFPKPDERLPWQKGSGLGSVYSLMEEFKNKRDRPTEAEYYAMWRKDNDEEAKRRLSTPFTGSIREKMLGVWPYTPPNPIHGALARIDGNWQREARK
ncbi:hypothetical protein N7454_004544 [Penicillium verhagenii]|nr:hypothetical protein N7454_004544 [Penicillium verhagenii]